MVTVLSVGQWQGSSAPVAPRLVEGARLGAELTGGDSIVVVPVVEGEGQRIDGVKALDVLLENHRLTWEALSDIDDLVITVGGDCGVDLAPLAAARARYGDELKVLWLDAHPDVNSPETLPSGSFHGMVLRTLLGDGPAALRPAQPLTPAQVILGGVRGYEPGEREYIQETGLKLYDVENLTGVLDELHGPVYVHLDLDVLDPADFTSVSYPEPDGVRADDLIALISQLDNVIGAAITEHAPAAAHPAEAEILRRLGAALKAAGR
jgi:arginase